MIAQIIRIALVAIPLASPALTPAQAAAAEQDTANGVAPAKRVTGPGGDAGPQTQAAASAAPSVASTLPAVAPAPDIPDAKHYCDNIATVAAEARFAWQTRKLSDLQAQVSQRIGELEKRQGELQASLDRRDAAMKQAHEALVTIYAKMQPDAAAAQMALLEDSTAAAILAQLNPRQSSAILNEIKPERASQLVGAMTSLPQPADKSDGKKS